MRKTTVSILLLLTLMIIGLLSSCKTVRYSYELGIGATASVGKTSEGISTSMSYGIYTMRTERLLNNGKEGILNICMENFTYTPPLDFLDGSFFEFLYGPAFNIKLKNPNHRLTFGLGPHIRYFPDLDSTSINPIYWYIPNYIGIGVAGSFRINSSDLGISGYISAGTTLGNSKPGFNLAFKGGLFVSILLNKREFETTTK